MNASSSAHVSTALQFAQEHNIRVIVKSTGHDLLGKSSGSGSLSIWMHSFRALSFTQSYLGANTYGNYSGPAARIEAGVLTYEVYEGADAQGLHAIGGTCPTVSISGGYAAGGGHSLLSSRYGLAADNVLEWEVVTANGSHVVASPSQNADLYWALSGGGPGVFGVVVSVTVKAYQDYNFSAAALSFNLANSPNEDTFWAGVEAFSNQLPLWNDQGAASGFTIIDGQLALAPLALPNGSKADVEGFINPLLKELDTLKIPYNSSVAIFGSYLDLYTAYYGPLPYGNYPSSEVQASRLLPRSALTNQSHDLAAAYRKIAAMNSGQFWIVGNAFRTPRIPAVAASNAVLPAWRETDLDLMVVAEWKWNATWADNLENEDTLHNSVLPLLKQLSPGSGTYLNEGDPHQSDWINAFYGDNYDRLREVKKAWDSTDTFYARTGVGSEDWDQDAQGRLCKL